MSSVTLHAYTFDDYLAIEDLAGVRHEFLQGEIYAMAGGTPEHAAMAAAITALLGAQLAGGQCRVYSSDLRVRILETGLATYPDVTVVCGRSERDPASPTHVVNPKVVFEIPSDATADYDRGEKLRHYKTVPSLQAVVLFDHRSFNARLWARAGAEWAASDFGPGQVVSLSCIGCNLPVDAVYAAAAEA
jgi:Uma2 family endonuclease